jgi:hypothetical protein
MTTIIDPELTVRLGALHPDEAARIHEYATAAFLWRGLRQDDALDVARGLHWRAVGRDPTAPAGEVVAALALHPLAGAERDRLAGLLDVLHRPGPAGPPGLEAFRRLGRRLSVALDLLDKARTIA